MYILRTKYKENVIISDLGVIVMWNDKDGTIVEKDKFNQSLNAKQVLDKLIIESTEGDYSEIPEKNVIDTESLLPKIQSVYDDMTVYIRNYSGSGNPAIAMYVDKQWKILSAGGNGSGGGFSGNYNDLLNKPDFSTVATSGDYNDLTNKPTIPTLPTLATVATSGKYSDLINKPVLSTVATSGSYNDLSDKPVMPTLSSVATSGDYNDLSNKPVIPTLPTLSAVATSGSYNDLSDKPVIPVLPTLATVATTGSYNDLLNKPVVPTKTSDLTKDDVYTKVEIDSKIVAANSGISKYQASGSTDGSCYVVATGDGVTFTKTGNSCQIVVPNGVQLLNAQVHFTATEIGSNGNCVIDYGVGTDYTNIVIPQYQVVNDVSGSRAYKVAPFPPANLNTSAHTLQLTGLTTNIGIWIKLQF